MKSNTISRYSSLAYPCYLLPPSYSIATYPPTVSAQPTVCFASRASGFHKRAEVVILRQVRPSGGSLDVAWVALLIMAVKYSTTSLRSCFRYFPFGACAAGTAGGTKVLCFVPLTAQLGRGAQWNVRASMLAQHPGKLRCSATPAITLCLIEFDCSLWHDGMTVCRMSIGPPAGCRNWMASRPPKDGQPGRVCASGGLSWTWPCAGCRDRQ